MFASKLKAWLFPVGIFIAILLLGIFLRLHQLNLTDFWYDEAFTGQTIRLPWKEMFDVITQDKNHPPLFYALVKSWTMLLGSTSAVAIRSFSVIFGIASVPLVYAIAQQLSLKEQAKKIFGLVSMFVFAISPFFVAYSVEARSYSLILFLSLASLFFFIRAMKTPYRLSWNALFCIVLLYVISKTHFLSILIGTGYIVSYVLLLLEDKQWLYNKKFQLFGGLFSVFSWVGGTWVWNAFNFRRFIDKQNLSWIPVSDLSQLPHALYAFLFGVDRQANGLPPLNGFAFPLYPMSVAMVLFIVLVVVIVLAFQKLAKNKQELRDALLLLSVGFVPLAVDLLGSSLQLNIYVDRYVIGAGAFMIFFVFYIVWQVLEKNTVYVLAAYVVVLCCLVYPTPMVRYTNAIASVSDIANQKEIVIANPIDYLVFKYYMPNTAVFLIQNPAGYPYDWPMMPPSIEIAKDKVEKDALIFVHKSDGQSIPSSWQKVGESKEFIIWKKS